MDSSQRKCGAGRPDGPCGSEWTRRWRTSAARPQEPSRLHARPRCVQPTSWPLCVSRCLGRVVGRDSSRGQLSPKFDAGRTGCKVAAATYSDGWVASRLQAARARHLDTFVRTCALGWRQSPQELSGCSGRRAIDPPSSGRPSRDPGVCTGSSGSLRVRTLVIRPGGGHVISGMFFGNQPGECLSVYGFAVAEHCGSVAVAVAEPQPRARRRRSAEPSRKFRGAPWSQSKHGVPCR